MSGGVISVKLKGGEKSLEIEINKIVGLAWAANVEPPEYRSKGGEAVEMRSLGADGEDFVWVVDESFSQVMSKILDAERQAEFNQKAE